MDASEEEETYICEICHKVFHSKKSFWSHKNRNKTPCLSKEQVERLKLNFNQLQEESERYKQELILKDQQLKDTKQSLDQIRFATASCNDLLQNYEKTKLELDKFKQENFHLKNYVNVCNEKLQNAQENDRILTIITTMMKENVDTLMYFKTLFQKTTIKYIDIQELTKLLKKSDRYVPEKVKKEIHFEQLYKCKICETLLSPSSEVDHIIPLYFGGGNERNNLQAICASCHSKKTVDDATKLYYDLTFLHSKLR